MAKLKNLKIKNRPALKKIVNRLHRQGKKVVFTNGCYDILHIGHVQLFRKSRSLGDALIVGINSDSSIRRLKGPGRPLVGQDDRARVLEALEPVDYVAVFGEDTPYELISEIKPDILVKGSDYRMNEIVGRGIVKRVVRFPLVKGRSTSGLIEKIVRRYGKTAR